MTDSIIEKANAVVHFIREGKVIAATDDNFNLSFLQREILNIEPNAIFKVKKNRLLIKIFGL